MKSRTQNGSLARFGLVALLVSTGVFSSVALFGSNKEEASAKKRVAKKVIRIGDRKVISDIQDSTLSPEERARIREVVDVSIKELDGSMEELDKSMKDLELNMDIQVFDSDSGEGRRVNKFVFRKSGKGDSIFMPDRKTVIRFRNLNDSVLKFTERFNLRHLNDSVRVLVDRLPALKDLPELRELPKCFAPGNFNFRFLSDSLGGKKCRRIIIIETDDEEEIAPAEKGEALIAPGDGSGMTEIIEGKESTIPMTLDIYPNPTDGKINLNIHAPQLKDGIITVTDIEGREIYRESLSDFSGDYNKAIDLSGKGKGSYILSISSNGKTMFSEKIMLE